MKKVWFFLTFLLFVCIIGWEKIFTFLYTKMKNKKILVKWCFFALLFLVFWISYSKALTLELNVQKTVETLTDSILRRNIVPIHFADNGNDFWWFIYFSNGINDDGGEDNDDEEEEVVELSDEVFVINWWSSSKECKRQMKWFYYNAERWERLWPIDSETWSKIDTYAWFVTTTGWIYTLCRSKWYSEALQKCEQEATEFQSECVSKVDKEYAQDNAYYGRVKNTLILTGVDEEKFVLWAWVKYDVPAINNANKNKWISVVTDTKELIPNFIRYKNKIPVGLVYDNNWWVWFAGCRIEFPSLDDMNLKKFAKHVVDKLKPGGSWIEALFKPHIDGDGNEDGIEYSWPDGTPDISIDCSSNGNVANSLIKVIVEWLVWMSRESDLWVIGNQTNSKMQYFSSSDINNATLINYAKRRAELLCRWKWKTMRPDDIEEQDKIICVENADVVLNDDLKWRTLIVKGGDVTVSPFANTGDVSYYDVFVSAWDLIINETDDRFVFDKNWFVVGDQTVSGFSGDVNSSLISHSDYTWTWVAVGSFIRWNFVVNGKVKATTEDGKLHNKYFVYGKFTTKNSLKELEDVFSWRCKNWYSSDNSFCPPSVKREWVYVRTNPYENASLVVIDQNYDSLLFGE